MAGELVKVAFHGDELDAIQDVCGKVWVSLRRCCENLGLAPDTQARKLKGKAWAVATEKVATGSDGKQYSMTCVDLDTLPGWLFSIEARKVKEPIREKLIRYQREAARVLADHFVRKTEAAPELKKQLELVRGELAQVSNRLDGMQLAAASAAQEAVKQLIANQGTGPRLSGPFWTVASWLEENMPHWNTTAEQRHAIGQDAKRRVMRACPGERVGYFNRDLAFVAHQEYYLARSAQHAYRKAMREGKAQTFGLFADETTAKIA